MLLDQLNGDLQKIFGLRKATFDMPNDGNAVEQDVLFITIDNSPSRVGEGSFHNRVTGTLRVYSEMEKLPPGFFAKRIGQAPADLTKPFFFFNVEQMTPWYQNIAERSTRFLYYASEQYNPDRGRITEVDFDEGES